MQRIYYAGEHFLTGTDIANALVSYAAALAQRGSAGAIEIPVRHEEDGRTGVMNFLVGPASQIMAEEVDAPGLEEIRDDNLVTRLHALTTDLAPMHPVVHSTPFEHDDSVDFDWTDEV
jgi:hypothetical protein